ncbi:MAG: hypothetical protein QOD26_2645 [Betaproteobacteria bacterium]|jgi:hypothetical protein|nr:hypothetical protein [Betaproteobacteria bacterium]
MTQPVVVTREQLYEQVWSIPTQTLAKQYGISDVGLSKICRRLNVPKPGLGYWAKVEAGKHPPRTRLPARALEHSYEIRPRPPALVETDEQRQRREARGHLEQSFSAVSVPNVLVNPHPLTRKTQEYFRAIEGDLKRPPRRTSPFGGPELGHVRNDQKGRYECKVGSGFPLVVSLIHLDRALRFLDTWTKEVTKLGFAIRAGEKEDELAAWKDGQGFAFALREGYKRHEFSAEERKARETARRYPYDYEWVGSDSFEFTIDGPIGGTYRQWKDGKTRLEVRVPEILAELVELVPLAKRLKEEKERQERARAEEERRRYEIQARLAEEKRQIDSVVAAAVQLARSETALRFLDQLEAEYFKAEGDVPEAVALWLNRTREIARKSNPVMAWVDELRRKAAG